MLRAGPWRWTRWKLMVGSSARRRGTLGASDVQETLEKALAEAKLDRCGFGIVPGCSRTTGRAMCLASCAASSKVDRWSTPAARPTIRKPQVLLG
jgi:hypothetical protein